jgi:hypothetical protein
MLEKKWEYKDMVHQLFIEGKRAFEQLRREVLHNIFIVSGVPMKLVRYIQMFLNESCNKVYKTKVHSLIIKYQSLSMYKLTLHSLIWKMVSEHSSGMFCQTNTLKIFNFCFGISDGFLARSM